MKKACYALLGISLYLLASISCGVKPASATEADLYCFTGTAGAAGAWAPCNSSTPLQIAGSFSATLSPLTPSTSGARGTAFTVNNADTSGTLPTGTSVIVTNVGTTNGMYCNVNGIAATTSDQYIAPNGGWFDFGIPNGQSTLHCISSASTTTANMLGGAGLGAGTGGGGGGGGSSAINTWGGASLGAATAWGTAPTGNMIGVNANILAPLGQALAAASIPVVLPAAQITTLTPPTTVTANLGTLNGAATAANQPTNAAQASTTSGQTGTLVQCAVTTSAPTYTTAQTDPVSCDTAGNVRVNVTNTNPNGRAAAGSSSPVVQPSAPSQWHLIAAASTNATSVKASAAVVMSCQLSGIGSTPAYLKIYNKASAPTVGTDTPVKTLIIPANATAANGAGSNIQFGPGGMALGTGFAAAVTGGITDADTTAVAASTFAINCDYE